MQLSTMLKSVQFSTANFHVNWWLNFKTALLRYNLNICLVFKLICSSIQLLHNVLVSTVQQNELAIHIHIIHPFGLSSHSGHTEHCIEFPVLYSRFSLVTQFMHNINSVYVSIPIYQFLPPPPISCLVFYMPFFLAHIPCKKLKVPFFHCIHDTFSPFLKRVFSS